MKLTAEKRDITGKKVKHLREDKKIPASIYGPGRESTSLILNPREFREVFGKVGYNKLFDIEISGEGKPVKVLVKEVQHNPVTADIYHVSLYQMDMNKKLTVDVPITIIGVSPAVKSNIGFLVTLHESLPVVCLPADIPADITIDISNLENINDSISITDLTLPEGVEWDTSISESEVISRISPPQKEIVEEVPQEAEAVEGEGEEKEEGEAAPEGEKAE
jgi:large subunit ribosomal protein L25